MNKINWTSKALKQLEKIKNKAAQKDILNAVDTLEAFPNCRNVKALTNYKYPYRLREGRWRIFFDFSAKIKIITIEEVKKRDERTY